MTKVAILWHMHQPFYQDLVTGEHILPWVRLHGLKDYYGMVALLREFPTVRLTFNLVPSLVVQLEAFAEDRARDRSLELSLKPAAELTDDDKRFILANFFHAQRARMIETAPRYAELLRRRDRADANGGALRAFAEGDFRDLQVWHKLAWVDPLFVDSDARVSAMIAKGRGFSEDDKRVLREVELAVLRAVVPEYRAAAARGHVELSASPFYHPILPLLCDTDVYLRTHPHSRMPRQRFRHPEDARAQLDRAAQSHQRTFGVKPIGLWPSEGSVSDAIVPLAAASGFHWMATDEMILARTLGVGLARDGYGHLEQPETLYRPYVVRVGGAEIACLFRDHVLSDLIGFTYASWGAAEAAQDFVGRLVEAGRRYAARTGGGEAVIPVILDGENAWEHFEGQGRPFLRALYRTLAAHPEIKTVTMSEAASAPATPLSGIFPGSWINGDFYIWIGHPDDHRAWGQLADARQAMDAPGPAATPEGLARAREELFIAEGSDWFWWYGDDHSSDHDLEFDDLFRRHLRNVYRSLDKPVPEELYVTNITTEPPRTVAHPPVGLLTPTLDGEVTSYFEWIGAGELELSTSAGSMHQVAPARRPVVTGIRYGFDAERLFVRVDLARRAQDVLVDKGEIRVSFFKPANHRLAVSGDGLRACRAELFERRGPEDWHPKPSARPSAAAAQILEMGVRLTDLGVQPGDTVSFFVTLLQDGHALEQYPAHHPLDVQVPGADFAARLWSV
jgi:alpha-amylase/alpha-mannosidase (GH57 family)